jgi:Tol biopolymer transport system component
VRLSPGTRLGPYEVLALLGTGGMGEVYRARDTRLDRTVAIKVLAERFEADAGRRERFDREARAVAALNHPHICHLHDVGETTRPSPASGADPIRFLAMEYLEGLTLAERLVRGPLPILDALRSAAELADALDHAHRRGLVHRDLKPANVMLTKDGAKLLDFGLSRLQSPPNLVTLSTVGPDGGALTAEGDVIGTFPYMAPEQLAGREADTRSDIFAFGATLYEMTTGRRAFEGATAATLSGAILHTDPPPISSLQPLAPPALDRLVARCLAKDPDDRWQSARDLMLELKWIAEQTEPLVAARRRGHVLALVSTIALSVLALAAIVSAIASARRAPAESFSTMLRFLPPAGLTLGEVRTVGPVTVSPDGRRVAYVAAGADGIRLLRVQALDSPTAQALPGTDGASYPFWSPDNRSLGFFAGDRLKRIEVASGPPQTLCGAILPRGGTWNRAGVIVFAANGGAQLYQVPAAGGMATTLTFARPNRESYWPDFLPDGRHFLYFGRREKPGLYLASLDSGDKGLLLEGQYVAAVYASGHLVFQKGGAMAGTLHAQPFDLDRFELTGEPVALAEHVAFYPFFGRADFSVAQNGTLVYGGPTSETVRLTWIDRKGTVLAQVPAGVGYDHIALSTDDSSIAAGRLDPETQSQDLWTIDAASGVTVRLTSDSALDSYPVWSPDGRRILFGTPARDVRTLYQKATTGTGREEVFFRFDERIRQTTQWSIDGAYVVYGVMDPKTKWDVAVLPAATETDGGERKPRPYVNTEFNEHHAQLSPDGRWMAYASDESGEWEVYVGRFPVPTERVRISTGGGVQPRWRRDGRELFYLTPDGTIVAVPVQAASTFTHGRSTPLFRIRVPSFRDRGWNPRYVPAADGQRFLVNAIEDPVPSPISVILDWPAALRR